MKIAAFSKFLAYGLGGAEVSTLELLKECAKNENNSISLITEKCPAFLGKKINSHAQLPGNWENIFLDGGIHLNRFVNTEYVLNRARLRRWFSTLEVDELWAYGSFAPAAILGFKGSCRYFIRSETDLAIFQNYHSGLRWLTKSLYSRFEYPSYKIYQRDLELAIHKSTVVANSKYMAARAHKLYGVEAQVIYPPVSVSLLQNALANDITAKKWVVFVGDSPVKGIHHVIKVARLLIHVNFRIVSRFVDQPRQDGNILWVPWESEPWRVYSGARLVIVPSQWEEAYGRVAREAYLLGIPVLVSAVGGLPEAVDEDKACQVEDYRSPEAWRLAIINSLSSAPFDRLTR
jgi:glycosyltransferase involved in cell wall biosynthesis